MIAGKFCLPHIGVVFIVPFSYVWILITIWTGTQYFLQYRICVRKRLRSDWPESSQATLWEAKEPSAFDSDTKRKAPADLSYR